MLGAFLPRSRHASRRGSDRRPARRARSRRMAIAAMAHRGDEIGAARGRPLACRRRRGEIGRDRRANHGPRPRQKRQRVGAREAWCATASTVEKRLEMPRSPSLSRRNRGTEMPSRNACRRRDCPAHRLDEIGLAPAADAGGLVRRDVGRGDSAEFARHQAAAGIGRAAILAVAVALVAAGGAAR